MIYDKIILGAGLYGLYAALFCAKKGQKVLVLEYDREPFSRATYINQARVHMGYHYPRSLSTAIKSAGYFKRFHEDYGYCIHREFEQIYATSSAFSWTDAKQFQEFCRHADIRCDHVIPGTYFKEGMCDGTYQTMEYTYDAQILKQGILKEISRFPSITMLFGQTHTSVRQTGDCFEILLKNGDRHTGGFLLNATYASVNQVLSELGYEPFQIKYELCEIILCKVSDNLHNVGLTVMDGPFFSIMPFGKTGMHSLTSVTFTPHVTSFDALPSFDCQSLSKGTCSPRQLGNCNDCPAKPRSAYPYMSSLARKYMRDEFQFEYISSLYSMKPILKASEIDDSRPTVIRKFSDAPAFYSVLSGKINTVYDLNEILQ